MFLMAMMGGRMNTPILNNQQSQPPQLPRPVHSAVPVPVRNVQQALFSGDDVLEKEPAMEEGSTQP